MSAELARRLEAMGIRDLRVLGAVARVSRALFVPACLRAEADGDFPLPIGLGQTISQPFVVAYMTERLQLAGGERVLEVGTGSGYQTALLALLARSVHSVEILPELWEGARRVLLSELALENVTLRVGDGTLGWPEEAPFDRILVAAAGPEVPPPLLDQLAPGGKMILPVGPTAEGQVLRLLERTADGRLSESDALAVRFVPLTHERRDPRGGPPP
ncbi:MAG TPA: protein-L-isoaspartate(D-aspartate) O-methyltransferase [Anaeromyxobacter sp.]|nr:protein-L-isoaspartate(D-aspartate) O-methyltransferase [Anaeromyxobacter sp.]